LLDPTDPLVYGSLGEISLTLAEAANRLFGMIQLHIAGEEIESELVACMEESPEICQVRYPFRGHNQYPLTIFSATGCILGVRAAYEAFSEAIGIEDFSLKGLPLHVAAANDNADVCKFLKNAFPEALSAANRHSGQTPLHLACRYGSKETIQTVINLTALQSMDKNGYYPIHRLCESPTADPRSFDILVNASALVADSVTTELQNPLHIAARYGNVGLLERVFATTPQSIRETDEFLQVPLHLAASENQQQSVEFLIRMFPAAIHAIDQNGNRPRDLTSDPWIKSLCSRYNHMNTHALGLAHSDM
jgi:Ankyrin repeats (3 copies)